MLLAIKDKIKGVLGYFVVGLITIPFALWGIQDYLSDDAPLFVASVNDTEISTQEFNRAMSRLRQNLQKKYNGKIPFEESVLKRQVVDQLINQRLLEEASYTNGYRISDSVLFNKIKNNVDFQRDGIFDREYYDLILSGNGKSPAQYENALRREMQIQQFQYSILISGFTTEKELKVYTDLDQQTRDFSYAIFNQNNTPADIAVTDEDINRYYGMNSDLFMDPEKIKIEYIEVNSVDLSAEIEVEEKKITEMYDIYTADISQKEERKTRHILLTVDEGEDKSAVKKRLQEIRGKIAGGMSFEALAKEHSKDPGSAKQGGDLDWVDRGQMVKPFETALFALSEGEVSEVIETQYGFHLIRFDEKRGENVLPLAEKREGFIKELRANSMEDKFYDITENLAALAYENVDNLAVPSEVLDLEIKITDLFTKQSGTGIAKHPSIREAAFSEVVLENGENSDIVELTNGHVAVLRVIERIPAKIKPLESVAQEIRSILEVRNSKNLVIAAVQTAKAKIIDGASIGEVIPKKITVVKTGPVKRRDIDKVDFRILGAGFSMSSSDSEKKSVDVVSLLTGGMALVVLDKINVADVKDKALIEPNRQLLLNNYANADLSAVLSSITSNAEIYRNTKVLEQ